MREFKLTTVDNKILNVCLWDDVKTPKAILQLVHGSAEHIHRYDKFAKFMNFHNIIVIADDHRGHGKTAKDNNQPLGFFAQRDGWKKVVNDEKTVNGFIEKQYPTLPIVMLGHSMGSFIARDYAIRYSQTIDGLVLTGTSEYNGFELFTSKFLAQLSRLFTGSKHRSKMLWKLTYKPLNHKFKKKNATGVEWLSKDEKNQKAFLNDPLCGFIFTNSAFYDMFTGLDFIRKPRNINMMRKNLPIMIMSGEDDPVGMFGIKPAKVYHKFEGLGYEPDLIIYPGVRHEILFDVDHQKVEKDLLRFFNRVIKAQH